MYNQILSDILGNFEDFTGLPKDNLSNYKFKKQAKEKALIEEFKNCLDWFPLTPHFHKHKIKSKKIDNKAVFWKIKNKRLNKAFLNFLIKMSLSKFVFPTMRRIYPSLFVNNIISVQPLPKPSAQVFYTDYSCGSGSQSSLSGSSACGIKTNP